MSQDQHRLFLIDGMALLFRSFYAMGQANLTAPDGTPTGAVYGFLRIISKILKDQKPSHFAVLWDSKEKNFRHALFPAYKANRSEPPEDIIPQIGLIQEVLPKLGVPSYRLPGFEADDLIGTLASRAKTWAEVFIVSADKDFMQLIDDRIKMFSLKKGEDYVVIDGAYVEDYFGVAPNKVVDVLAIMGDASDNVPGVKGIGEKGAAKLIKEFGSLEGVYQSLDLVQAKKQKQLLIESRESAFLSQRLVTIECNVPLDFPQNDIAFTFEQFLQGPHLRSTLNDLRMHSLLRSLVGDAAALEKVHSAPQSKGRSTVPEGLLFDDSSVMGSESSPPAHPPGQAQPHHRDANSGWGQKNSTFVTTWSALEVLLARLASPSTPLAAFDTETTGLDFMEDQPIGFSLCFAPGEAYYVPACAEHFAKTQDEGADQTQDSIDDDTRVWKLLAEALSVRTCLLVAHNAKYDIHLLLNKGVSLGAGPVACSMVAAWLIDAQAGGYSLDAQSLKVLGLIKIPTSTLIGKQTGRSSMNQVPAAQVCEYACEDVDATLRLWREFEPRLRELKLYSLFWELEMPLLQVLVGMERTGVNINSEVLAELTVEIQDQLSVLEREIYEASGENFKISSPKQLGAVLFEKMKIHEALGFKGKMARTSLGYKTDAAVLEKFEEHPVIQRVQEFRELSKLLSTYILVLPQLVKKSTHRIHTSYHQIGTSTGRLSSSDPNLQNIPVRTVLGKRVRKAFCARSKNHKILAVDYSQIELRILAHLADDPTMIAAFAAGADIHRETSAKINGKAPSQVTPEERSAAKAINFGIIYGMGSQRLAREQGVTVAEAKVFIEKYFLNFSKIQTYIESAKQFAHKHGYAITGFGRIRPLPQLGPNPSRNLGEVRQAENMAVNSPIQGTAADIMKLGMLKVQEQLLRAGMETRMILQVHDELVFECPVHEVDQVKILVREALEGVVHYKVPLTVDVGVGDNWLEAK